MQKFLIVQPAFIGDVVLATALAEKLHQFYPAAQIDLLVRKGNEGLLEGHPFLRRVWVWDKSRRKTRNLFRLASAIRREGYDAVVNPHRFASSGLLTALSGAKARIGFDKNPLSRFYTRTLRHTISEPYAAAPVHEVQRNQRLIATLTDGEPAMPALYPQPADLAAAGPFQKAPYICIAPSSVWATKQFPAARWAELIARLPEHTAVLLLGGKGDVPLAEEIAALSAPRPVQNLCGRFSFLQSAALMRAAVMNYVNDSGPLHFCSAVNAPVTAVFCSTVPAFGFGPLRENGRVAEHPGRLYCRPCGLHGHKACPEGHFKCANEIPLSSLLHGF